MITRIQHPVGQGGFYSEHHRFPQSRVIVYDCGAGTGKRTQALTRVTTAFREEHSQIDVVVLSHFHADHVNGIGDLMKGVNRKVRIFLPYLSPEEADLVTFDVALTAFDRGGRSAVAPALAAASEWIRDPEKPDDNRIRIRISADAMESGREANGEYLGDISQSLGTRSHARPIQLWKEPHQRGPRWILKFYCKKAQLTMVQEVLKDLRKLGLKEEWLQLPTDVHDFARWLAARGRRKRIQRAYEHIPGADKSHNLVSMCCYSGPDPEDAWYRRYLSLVQTSLWPIREEAEMRLEPGWMGTGDLGLKDAEALRKFQDHYAQELPLVGTMQIPHHGSWHNSDHRLLGGNRILLTVSYGASNTYHHPDGRVILDMQRHGAKVWPVTDHRASEMRQEVCHFP